MLKFKPIWPQLATVVLGVAAGVALVSPAQAAGASRTVEVRVEGLNCTLCSEQMRQALKKNSGAQDIEPRLECGRIFLEMPAGREVNEAALNFTLIANGFNLKSVEPSRRPMAEIRKNKDTC